MNSLRRNSYSYSRTPAPVRARRPNAATWTLESVDGDFDPCSIREWLDVNEEGISAAERRAVSRLRPGQTYSGGGGAWAGWTVRRMSEGKELQHNGFNPMWAAIGLAAAGAMIYFATRTTGTTGSASAATTDNDLLSANYAVAVSEAIAAKEALAAARARPMSSPQEASAWGTSVAAAIDTLAHATARLNSIRSTMIRLGLPT
jgi:hypothetical protein